LQAAPGYALRGSQTSASEEIEFTEEFGLDCQMIEGLNALLLRPDDKAWAEQLQPEIFHRLVRWYKKPGFAHYFCAPSVEERTALMTEYASRVLIIHPHGHGRVRQKAALSSFHLPTNAVNHPAWERRSGKQSSRSRYQNRLLLDERISLTEHARVAGCSLIIDPDLDFKGLGVDARIARLTELLRFLEEELKPTPNSKDPLVQIALSKRVAEHDNLTIVGDWFYSESVATSFKTGYRQTVFTTHAPTVDARLTEFDQEFSDALTSCGWTAENSAAKAAEHLKKIVNTLTSGSPKTSTHISATAGT
jgi:hypothetical protein